MYISYSKPDGGRVKLQLPTDSHGRIEPLKQRPRTVAHVDRFRGKWQHHIGIAMIAWSRLTEAQLVQSQGRKDKLSDLIQRRYVMSPPDADAQVERLMQKCGF